MTGGFGARPMLCPVCGYFADDASAVVPRGEPPPKRMKPGDISLCINCGAVGIFANDLSIKKISSREARGILRRMPAVATAQHYIRRRGRRPDRDGRPQ
jgi:hypothetical protein